jgi:hypothetical protein
VSLGAQNAISSLLGNDNALAPPSATPTILPTRAVTPTVSTTPPLRAHRLLLRIRGLRLLRRAIQLRHHQASRARRRHVADTPGCSSSVEWTECLACWRRWSSVALLLGKRIIGLSRGT